MRNYIGLTVAACVVMLATAGVGKAQVVSITNTDWMPGPPATIQPIGQFTVPAKAGAQYRVAVDYGTFVNGAFVPYPANTVGIPNLDHSAAQNGAGGGNYTWQMAKKNCAAINVDTQVRAQLEVSLNGGAWGPTGSPTFVRAIP